MPDTDFLDTHFERLTRAVGAHGVAPGASTAISAARRRRRTTFGTVVAVAAIAIGGVTVAQLGGDTQTAEVVDDSHRPLPEPAPLSAGLSAATAGWTAAWDRVDEPGAEGEIGAMECLERAEESAGLSREPARSGAATLRTDSGALAYAAFAEFAPGESSSSVYDALTGAMTSCGATPRATPTYGDRGRATHLVVETGRRHDDVWVARLDQGVALLMVGGASHSADVETSLLVSDALLAAMMEGSTLQQAGGDGGGSASGYGSGSSSSSDTFEFPAAIGHDQLVAILGDAASPWDADDGKLFDLPCVTEAAEANSDSSTGSTIGSHAVVGYTSYTSFGSLSGLAALETILPRCDEASWTLHPDLVAGDSALWASSDAGTLFAVQHGPHLAVLQARELGAPADDAAAQVLALLQESVASARIADGSASDG